MSVTSVFGVFCTQIHTVLAINTTTEPHSTYTKAILLDLIESTPSNIGDETYEEQIWQVKITNGPKKNSIITIKNEARTKNPSQIFKIGDTVILETMNKIDGSSITSIKEQFRLTWLILLSILFCIIAYCTGGISAIRALGGLLLSIGILLFFTIPSIIQGYNPLFISIMSAGIISVFSLYLAHGYNRRTTISLVSTLLTLLLTFVTAIIFVSLSKLFGLGSEDSIFLLGSTMQINLRGLLLGGIIIGTLGVLDDITTAQTATIDELSKANHVLSQRELFQRGMSVGKEHVASLINTLALAYAGASLPILLLFYTNTDTPVWVTINSEFIAEEIVRTLVGSMALLLAVPIASFLAAHAFAFGKHTNSHSHSHSHGHI